MLSVPSSMHQHTHAYSHQCVPDDFTDYGPLIRAWQIPLGIDVPWPSAALRILPDYCWETWGFSFTWGWFWGRCRHLFWSLIEERGRC